MNQNISSINLNKTHSFFYQWLVGMTDGDGSFSMNVQNNYWIFTYKITLSTANLQVLYYIKKYLNCGHITFEHSKCLASYRIRNKELLRNIIFPIFNTYPL
ncbi:LAGLIDADG family homing endonuclease, partial [Paenibacillus sp. MAHUQ-46]